MGSYCAVVVGPPSAVNRTVEGVRSDIDDRDAVEEVTEYRTFSIDQAHDALKIQNQFDCYPYLWKFHKSQMKQYLYDLDRCGYDQIKGTGLWLVCYHNDPDQLLSENKDSTAEYHLDQDGGKSITPFSYDPAQDYVTEP